MVKNYTPSTSVSGDNAKEARAEAERRYPTGIVGLVRYEDWERDGERSAFAAGSQWQASQPREVEVSEALSAAKRIVDMYRHLVLDTPEDQRLHDEVTALADRAIAAALGGGE